MTIEFGSHQNLNLNFLNKIYFLETFETKSFRRTLNHPEWFPPCQMHNFSFIPKTL
jgi:hypothetical protein